MLLDKQGNDPKKDSMTGGGLPGKLSDCSETDPSKCEVFLVEGDSLEELPNRVEIEFFKLFFLKG